MTQVPEGQLQKQHTNNKVCCFVLLALQPIVVVFSQPGSGL